MTDTITNAPQKPNAMGGAPTTTQDVTDSVAPRPVDNTPNAPNAPSPNITQAAANNQNQTDGGMKPVTDNKPTQEQPHPMAKMFNGILKTMIGGPVTYVDANGQRREAPQSNGAMGKAIVAAALAGLMTPDRYRQGAFGTQVRDYGATAGAAAEAGSNVMQAARNKPQQMSDAEQAKRLATLNANATLYKNMAASTQQQHDALGGMIQSSQPLMDSVRAYESSRVTNGADAQPQALIAENLSREDAQAKMKGNHMGWTPIVTGSIPTMNPETGEMEEHPLYSIVDPNVKVPLNEEAANLYATVNPSYKGAWEKTGGKVQVPLLQAVNAQHLVDEAHVLQNFASSAGIKAAFPDAKIGKITDIMSGPDGRRLIHALDATRDAISSGAPTYQKLNALQSAPGGSEVLKALGLDPDKVNKFVKDETNAAIREQALAKEGGVGDKAPVSHDQQDKLVKSINGVEDPEVKSALLAYIPTDRALTMGEFEKVTGKLVEAQEKSHTEKLRTGDPEVLQDTAKSMLDGSPSSPKDLATIRSGGSRMLLDSMLRKGAEARGLNPIEHTFATQEMRAKAFGEYSDPNSKIGAQLSSFGTLMMHTAEAVDANANWVRTNSKYANSKISDLEETLLNDQDYQRFKTTIIAPMKEYMNFLNQNRAEHDADIKAMDRALGPNATPASALTALTVITQTADARAAGLGQKYLNTVKNNYEGLITPQALQVMQRLGIKSQAGPLSVALPRGWQGNAASPLTPEAKNMYWEASGHDAAYSIKLAKENGWK